jgi:type II secretory ATPase GspE/PulE/Tfp pilus assembly ATPase PilB-like protein
LCPACKVSEPATPEYIDELLSDYLHVFPADKRPTTREALLHEWQLRFGKEGVLMSHHSTGCEHCSHTGFKGRAGLHELMTVSREMRRLIQTGARAEELLNQALTEGLRTLRQDGIEKVLMGVSAMEEVRATSNA